MQTMKNKVQLIGNLGMDPEMKRYEGNRVMVSMALATHESYLDRTSGKRVQKTYWHQLRAWGEPANYAVTNLRKGTFVAVRGQLRHRQVPGDDGTIRYYSDVIVEQFEALAAPNSSSFN